MADALITHNYLVFAGGMNYKTTGKYDESIGYELFFPFSWLDRQLVQANNGQELPDDRQMGHQPQLSSLSPWFIIVRIPRTARES